MTFSRQPQTSINFLAYTIYPGTLSEGLRVLIGPSHADLSRTEAVELAQYILNTFPLDAGDLPEEVSD